MSKDQVILDAVQALKDCDYKATAIKVELEANLNRRWDESSCLKYILNEISNEVSGTDFDDEHYDDYQSEALNPIPGVAYAMFYNDGSVDSELTFTIKLDNIKNIELLPKFLKAFKHMASECGRMNVSGAGMHMALLNSRDFSYPSDVLSGQHGKFMNFRKSMKLLLPALYFLGSHNEHSRSLEYRRPAIESSSTEHGYEKYHAINYANGALEFRIFETCYNRPNAVLDNVVVMANAMKYWKNEYVPSGMEKITQSTSFGNDVSYELSRLYSTVEHIDLLTRGLMKLKPSYLSIKELKKERGFKVVKSDLINRERTLKAEISKDYEEYSDRFDWRLRAERYYFIADKLEATSRERRTPEIEKQLSIKADEYIKQEAQRKESKRSYIARNIRDSLNQLSGRYTLALND